MAYTEEIARKLNALKALAEKGAPGEKENAQRMLSMFIKKYSISMDELYDEQKELHFFPYSQEIERRLLSQVIYAVTGRDSYGCKGALSGRKRKKLGVECTLSEKIEIETNFAFYKRALQEELDIFFAAFANKNNIFPADCEAKDDSTATEEEKRRVEKISWLMTGMDRHIPQKALPTNGGAGHD